MDLPADDLFLRFEPALTNESAHFGHIQGFEDTFRLRKAQPVGDAFPADATYVMSPDFPDNLVVEDAVSTLDSEIVVSPRARAVFEAHGVEDQIEWLEVGLVNHKGRTEPERYAIANVLRHADAVDLEASAFMRNFINPSLMMNVTDLVIDESKIPDDVSVFRLSALPRLVGIRRDLAEAILAAGLTGFAFLRLSDFHG
jgi:hypothetical protein